MTENLPAISPTEALTPEELTALTESPPTANKDVSIIDIVALRKKGLTLEQIGKILGCTRQNIHHHLSQLQADMSTVDNYKTNRADIFATKQVQLLNALTPDAIKKMPGFQQILGIGVFYDKEQEEREKHETGNDISDMHLSLEEIERKLSALESGSEPDADTP